MEEWRDVPGSNGRYQIDISTKEGKCRSTNYKNTGKTKELTNQPNKQGRLFWCLTIGGKEMFYQAARWIAITYPELVQNEYFDGAIIDHIDTDPLNNHPLNLRWVTPSGNNMNSLTLQHMSRARKGKKGPHKPIKQFTKDGEFVRSYESAREAIRVNPSSLGLNYKSISACCRGKVKTHRGYVWKYAG